jgi:hypothetical protein
MEFETNEVCEKYLKELSDIYSLRMEFPTVESAYFERFCQLVKLVGDCNPGPLFIIEWTNSTTEIKSFPTYDDAYKWAYCDHLLKVTPFQAGVN